MTIHQHLAAAIDLGSNTFRLLVADCSAGSLKVLAKKMATVRLGRGLANNGLLHEIAMQKGYDVMRAFRKTLDHYQPEHIRICGTEALRRAHNSRYFLRKAEEILRLPIDIIGGEEEARLSLAGASAGFGEPLARPLLLVDVGGGSTELVFVAAVSAKAEVISVPLGVVPLTESFFTAPDTDFSRLDSLLAETLVVAFEKLELYNIQPLLIIGSGGTATSMAALDLNLSAYNPTMVHGYQLRSVAMEILWNRLINLSADKRNGLPCLGEGRGEILPAGIRIYLMLLKLLQQEQLRISDTGLLEGILLSSQRHALR